MDSVRPVAVEASEPKALPLHMNYEEYLAWSGEDDHAEWVNGEVIVHMPTKDSHQAMVGFLAFVIRLFIAVFDLGRLHVAPFEVKFRDSSREPDLSFIAKDHLDRLTPERAIGPPDLIVEIVSDDSVQRDRVDKFDEYEDAAVPEYWIIDHRLGRKRAQFYRLDANGQYQRVSIGPDGIYRSTVLPGFWLRVDWLWEAQPDVLRAAAEIIGPERVAQALRQAANVQPKS